MLEPLEKKIRNVWLRCSINLLLRHAGRVLTAAGIIAILSILAERLLAVNVISSPQVWAFWGIVIIYILLLWLLRQPSRLQVSLLIDERLKLHERFSTTLALSESEDPFADAARNESRRTTGDLSIRGHFPVRPSRYWIYAAGTWLIVGVLVLSLPQKDLLGFLHKKQQQQEQAQQIQQAKVDIKRAADSVKLAVRQLKDSELADALSDLDQASNEAKPQDVKREAIRKLGDLSEKVKDMQNNANMESVKMMQQMLKQLKGSPDLMSQQLRMAMAKGDFAQASNLLNQLQKELSESKLSEQQQKDISEQLRKLGEQLKELAENNEELEKELEKLGLDKDLAKLNEEQLRQALQQQGLASDKIEELMKKAAASRMAASRCAGLGAAMGACSAGSGGLSGEGLAALTDQLDEFGSLSQQLMMTEFTLAEINNAIAGLGQGMGDGFGIGQNGYGYGGGHGEGIGTSPGSYSLADELEQSDTKRTKVTGKQGQGPVIASWYFQDSQVKGEARRDFSEVIQAARDGAAEAISENEIPRKYEDAIKKYFGRLEESKTE